MFADRHGSYASSQSSTAESINSSFSSASWDTSFAGSSRRESFDSEFDAVKVEDAYNSAGMYNAMPMAPETMNGFTENGMLLPLDTSKIMENQTMLGYSQFPGYSGPMFDSFGNHHGLTMNTNMESISPAPGLGISPSFVNPTQTTFLNTYELNSPLRNVDFDNSPVSECATDFSFSDSPEDRKYCTPSYANPIGDCSSAGSGSATPSRSSSLRHSVSVPLQPAGMHTLQDYTRQLHAIQLQNGGRRHRVHVKREPESLLGNQIKLQRKAKKECPWDGCNKRFQRQEHLKRHERTHSGTDYYPCPFCEKIFGRSDNKKSHVKLHTKQEKKSSRTKYHPDAQAYYDSMNRKTTSKSGSSTKSESESPSSTKTVRTRM